MTPGELRVRAIGKAIELGPKPTNGLGVRQWTEERRCTVIYLSYLADRDAALLRRAAFETVGEWADPVTQDLLLDAVQEC